MGDGRTDVVLLLFFFFNDTATTEIYTLSLHDALPIWTMEILCRMNPCLWSVEVNVTDRKSTRLNSSHANISYAVFCLKKKTQHNRFICDGLRSRGGSTTRSPPYSL